MTVKKAASPVARAVAKKSGQRSPRGFVRASPEQVPAGLKGIAPSAAGVTTVVFGDGLSREMIDFTNAMTESFYRAKVAALRRRDVGNGHA